MRTIKAAALSAAICCAGLVPSTVKADFIYNLTVSGGWTGSGSISFDTLSGTDTIFSDVTGVSAFSFHVSTGNGSPWDYGLDDLAFVDWSIDSTSLDLTSLLLSTKLIPLGDDIIGSTAIFLTNEEGFHVDPCANFVLGSSTCVQFFNFGRGSSTGSGVLTVPEPASIALFVAGLLGLGWLNSRLKARSSSRRF